MNDESKEYTKTWFIENYSYCWHKNGEKLVSPEIIIDDLKGTDWTIQLYPRGQKYEFKGDICLCLNRRKDDDGPEELQVNFELSLLAEDGSSLHSSESEQTFRKRAGWGYPSFLPIDELLLHRTEDYLPRDTLSVRCRMWIGEGNRQPVTQICARSRIGIEKFSFLHVIDEFSTLQPRHKKTIQIRSSSKKVLGLFSTLYFSEDFYCEEKIMMEIKPSSANQILSQCKFSLLDVFGNVIECGEANNRFDSTGGDIEKLPLSLTRQAILNNKSDYLPNDKLTLICECTFSTGVEYHKIESTLHQKPIVALNQMSKTGQKKDIYNATKKLSGCTSATDDFEAIYNNQFLTDVVLTTKTKSFPAHKIVLCARSPVFKSMMTNNMKEKNTGCIQIDDLENDIVHQLLLFLYSDQVENLEWKSAMKLFYAADKYEVDYLKVMCSAFLIDNISTSTAGELLLLADTHNDSDLMKAVENYIFEHEEQVFGSKEWGSLIETNPLLVSKTMCLKYIRKL